MARVIEEADVLAEHVPKGFEAKLLRHCLTATSDGIGLSQEATQSRHFNENSQK